VGKKIGNERITGMSWRANDKDGVEGGKNGESLLCS
jgi:hypothetical protein